MNDKSLFKYLLVFSMIIVLVSLFFGSLPQSALASEAADDIVFYRARPFDNSAGFSLDVAKPVKFNTSWALVRKSTGFTSQYMANIIRGLSERLEGKQNDSTDHGWNGMLTDGDAPEVPNTISNVVAPVALGMLRAYILSMKTTSVIGQTDTSDGQAYLDAALEAKAYVNNKINFNPSASDFIFLHNLYYWLDNQNHIPQNNPGYGTAKTALIAYITQNPVATLYGSFFNRSPQIAHWWAANLIEACNLYEDPLDPADDLLTSYSDQLVNYALTNYYTEGIENVGAFVFETDTNSVRTLSHARMIEVLAKYYSTTYSSQIEQGINFLKNLQNITYDNPSVNGTFRAGGRIMANGEVRAFRTILAQDQAFTIKAMVYAKQTNYVDFDTLKGPYWGVSALMSTAVVRGSGLGFLDENGDEYPEDNAEVLDAIYASCKEGDVDKSGQIVPGDALQALQGAIAQTILSGPAFVSADRDSNGFIEPADAFEILLQSVGKGNPIRPE